MGALRSWLSSGGIVDPANPMSADFERLLSLAIEECAGDPAQLSAVLTDRCVLEPLPQLAVMEPYRPFGDGRKYCTLPEYLFCSSAR